uniref:Sterile alpha motif domain containing 14 n=1 Tax=Electrophorus electricus TaxID=8005 RepID=A0AAY5EYW6_ELEEL
MCHGADHLTEAVPETQRLDSSLQKAKAQLSIKTRRHRPSRSRLRDSLSSMEGEDSLDGKVCVGAVPTSCAPLHASFGRSSPSPDLCLSSSPARRDRGLAPDLCPVTPEMRAEEQGPGMHRHLLSTSSQEQGTGRLSTSSQEALLPAASGFSGRPCSRSENSSPAHLHDSHDFGSDEPGSPTVLLDKKTRRSFLNLGVTLRRTYGKVRKDRSNRLSAGNRTEARSSRSSGPPFVPFSWFSDRLRSSSSPKTSKILSEVTPLPPTPSSLLNVKRANCF